MVWSLSKNRCYNTRSGYKLLETILYVNSGQKSQLPLVERQLWRNLCKCKYPPKVKNFMWRAMSGVLAVKQRLRSRGIVLDTTCQVCRTQQESICHVFFHCRTARETWERARISLPPAGFSSNLVFLNLHHLITFSKKCDGSVETSPRFPWILWKNWKARNAFCFEQVSYEPSPRQRRLDKLAVLL